MSRLIYFIATRIYLAGIHLAALFLPKARQWVQGRRGIFEKLSATVGAQNDPVIWVHCASLGEFEQGRPILEALKNTHPQYKILLSFFSPSGYELRKNYPLADWVSYLPMDGPVSSLKFIRLVRPQLVIFVKYEYWYYYLHYLNRERIPLLLVAAIFRPGDVFFKWYGNLHRRMLNCFTHLFVQNDSSRQLIWQLVPEDRVSIAGDTRFDRVLEIAGDFQELPAIADFSKDRRVLVAGSSWPDDENRLKLILDEFNELSLIIAPHEVTEDHLNFLIKLFGDQAVRFSRWQQGSAEQPNRPRVLLIDNIGMLSRLYYYGDFAYIGGGFNRSGIHNTLEAAVYGKPVIFGPNYQKFAEAINLIKIKAGFSYNTDNELLEIIGRLINDSDFCQKAARQAANYVQEQAGASARIMTWIRQNGF